MKKFIAALFCLTITLSGCTAAQSVETSSQPLFINGKEEKLVAYMINDSNYFKIRDVAYHLDFNIDYDGDSDSIVINPNETYRGKEPENERGTSPQTVEKSSQKVYINDKRVSDIEIYNINGSNYFKIRDVARSLDFGCRYNKAKNRIELSNEFFYNSADVFGRAKDSDILKVTYIDVGQGDSALIEFPDNAGEMLIDAGTPDCYEHLLSYLDEELPDGKLEYVVATHPHSDHIGSMRTVIENYEIDNFYNSKNTHTTKTYKNMTALAKNKGIVTEFKIGQTINVSKDVSFTFLAPVRDYDDLNDSSTVIRIDYKNNSFLFTGDIETSAEADMINDGVDLSSDVVKVAHHGSRTSSSNKFIKKTGAKYAVASLALENEYNHPSHDVINRYQQRDAIFLATSKLSDIIVTSDGHNIKAYPEDDYDF